MSLLLGPSGSCAPPACTAALCTLCGSVQGCFCVWMHWARPHLSLQSHLQEEQPLVENQPQESPSRGHCRFLPELSAQEGSLSTGLHQPHCKGSSGPCQGVTTLGLRENALGKPHFLTSGCICMPFPDLLLGEPRHWLCALAASTQSIPYPCCSSQQLPSDRALGWHPCSDTQHTCLRDSLMAMWHYNRICSVSINCYPKYHSKSFDAR